MTLVTLLLLLAGVASDRAEADALTLVRLYAPDQEWFEESRRDDHRE